MDNDFTFAKLSDLKQPVSIRISQLEGLRQSSLSDLYVTCQLVADNKPLTIPFRTSFKAFKNSYTWNEWISFPIRYSDLPLSSQIAFTVWDIGDSARAAVPVGGTTFRLFGKKWTLRRGKHRMLLWPNIQADPSVDSTTPSKLGGTQGAIDEMGRLEKLVKKYERGDLQKSEWLDKLTFRKMEEIHAKETEKSENMFLYIDLPRFDFPVIFSEPESIAATASASLPPPPQTPTANQSTPLYSGVTSDSHVWLIVDPEVARENPVEDKHRRLVRSHRSGPYDRELKPNSKDRDHISQILAYAPSQSLSAEEKDLIWKFRFYLARDKRGLTKFLKAVTWRDGSEVKQAVEELLPRWTEIDTDDALELLGPSIVDSRVRAFAVRQLARADDDELLLYLLQLVQALKFESAFVTEQRSSRAASATNAISYADSGLADFLIARGVANPVLGNRVYWYLMVEVAMEDKVLSKMYGRVVFKFMNKILEVPGGSERRELLRRQGQLVETLGKYARMIRTSKDSSVKKKEKLQALLADARTTLFSAPSSVSVSALTGLPGSGLSGTTTAALPPLPLPLNAKVMITDIVPSKCSVFKSAMYPLLLTFTCAPAEADPSSTTPSAEPPQTSSATSQSSAPSSTTTAPTPTPSTPTEYSIIFKDGDDMRQDQLVIQLISLMDRLLRTENLDLKLTPYDVLATSSTQGMAQFIQSKTIASIVSEFGNVQAYLRSAYPDEGSVGTWGITPGVVDTFVRSCAGYCVVTYLLGVGDRHLDNLLVAPDGHFFHVDFGYILGRDPKPFPPAVKVCKEMVDGMGGAGSPHYMRFKSFCFTAFTILRKSANLILNLVTLMVDANIPDIGKHLRAGWGGDVGELVMDKFLLGMSEEEAIEAFESLLNETSYFTVMLDRIHDLTQQYWRT